MGCGLPNQSIVVTGAFGTLGSAVARAFAAHGAVVSLVDVAPQAPDAIVRDFLAPHRVWPGVDLTNLASASRVFDALAAERGIDVLVNVAGGFRWQLLADSDTTVWQQMFAMNLQTAVIASRAALPHFIAKSAGRIINIGAGAAAHRTEAGMGAYAASKAGVHRFTESLAAELKDHGITVNAVLPGTIDTPANRRDMPQADASRWVQPEAIANVIVFLASDAAHAVTGALIPVSGRG